MSITAQEVATWGKFPLPTGDDLDALERVVAAVVEHVTAHYYVDDPATDAQEQAMILAAAGLWRRRDTPEGIAAFADVAAVRVQAVDKDVAAYLTRRVAFS